MYVKFCRLFREHMAQRARVHTKDINDPDIFTVKKVYVFKASTLSILSGPELTPNVIGIN